MTSNQTVLLVLKTKPQIKVLVGLAPGESSVLACHWLLPDCHHNRGNKGSLVSFSVEPLVSSWALPCNPIKPNYLPKELGHNSWVLEDSQVLHSQRPMFYLVTQRYLMEKAIWLLNTTIHFYILALNCKWILRSILYGFILPFRVSKVSLYILKCMFYVRPLAAPIFCLIFLHCPLVLIEHLFYFLLSRWKWRLSYSKAS